MVVYGPNENDTVLNKEKCWDSLTEITEQAKGIIFVAGNFNKRVRKIMERD